MKTIMALVMFPVVAISLAGCTSLRATLDGSVTDLVDRTCIDLRSDSSGTIAKINAGKHPYVNATNSALYVFVYDTDVNVIAHPNKSLVGKNLRDEQDIAGKKFRAEIVESGIKHRSGWSTYQYAKPGEPKLQTKATYYKLALGSDGVRYIVCSGRYGE